jgi:hypothetical protein
MRDGAAPAGHHAAARCTTRQPARGSTLGRRGMAGAGRDRGLLDARPVVVVHHDDAARPHELERVQEVGAHPLVPAAAAVGGQRVGCERGVPGSGTAAAGRRRMQRRVGGNARAGAAQHGIQRNPDPRSGNKRNANEARNREKEERRPGGSTSAATSIDIYRWSPSTTTMPNAPCSAV